MRASFGAGGATPRLTRSRPSLCGVRLLSAPERETFALGASGSLCP